jgi:DNA-binding transcriptional MerR regulator
MTPLRNPSQAAIGHTPDRATNEDSEKRLDPRLESDDQTLDYTLDHALDSAGGEHFKTRDVVKLLDLSRRQLQYWAKTGLIVPSGRTPGGHHRYSFDDLVALKATKRLIDAGVSVQKIRQSVRALQNLLPQVGRPLGELVLVATGDVVLVFQHDTVFEAITGQEWVFPVAEFEREVAAYRSNGERLNGRSGKSGKPDEIRNPASETVNGLVPARPGPRGARRNDNDWSETG